jgi:hypothetical protein
MNSTPSTFKRGTAFLSLLILLICLLILLVYGWTWYCTVTNRGVLGQWHAFIGLSEHEFAIYNFAGATVAFVLVVLQVFGLITKQERLIRRSFWIFLVFFFTLCCFEIYFQMTFIPKG